jgi:acidic leucine-rich nuclear phosphoprotein 32 family protein B
MGKDAISLIRKLVEENNTEELYLDEIKIPSITPELKKAIEGIDDVIFMSMNECEIASLANFPNVPNLIRLELLNNKFTGSDLKHLTHLKSLQSLSIGINKIDTYEEIEQLKKLEELVQVDLSNTPLSEKPDYRKRLFEILPKLQILDNCDAEGNEFEYETSDEEDEEHNSEEEDEEEDDEDMDDEDEDDEEDDEDDEDEDDEDEEVPHAKRVKK